MHRVSRVDVQGADPEPNKVDTRVAFWRRARRRNDANLAEQITREFEREQRRGGLAVVPSDIPLSYESITPRG